MINIQRNLEIFQKKINNSQVKLIAVSKTKPIEALMEAYTAGCRVFGENKVQEMAEKYEQLPKDIEWHLIGHLQTNKVKYIAGFVSLIHAVDSFKLLKEINKQGLKNGRVISCLLQIHIAEEDTKFGLSFEEATEILNSPNLPLLKNIKITGIMGMATFTENKSLIRKEFGSLRQFMDKEKSKPQSPNVDLRELSMGMSGDYEIAIEEGSTMIRVGSAIFGERNYEINH